MKSTVDSRLEADSHALFDWKNCHLRLHKNASLPWLIIIPHTDEIEFCDLNHQLQREITAISHVIGRHFKSACGAEKINFAAIGNVVQQLHIHVIGRHRNDPLWPDVVWGNVLPDQTYHPDKLTAISATFKNLLATES
ncbi:HIT family protein [Marinicella litoralis]|uniref:Diadenosine tetraphosphate (Ap4A) HIT family hydrolase n=1 Tax=Marinicella litoralis TaxID=644220 RepID=A0A4R6XYN0_9GAMM|nr:HIT family protein [Marinicella litoralis]TDR23749.1 diadenosine tetraphosphate (Ap4A) HIT family hydrolase [Marinicella litoralis]